MSSEDRVGEDSRNCVAVDLHDIQATILRHRPEPYFGTHVFLHINDPHGGREFLRRLAPHIGSAADWWNVVDAWIAVAITYPGLVALGASFTTCRSVVSATPGWASTTASGDSAHTRTPVASFTTAPR